MRVSGDTAGDTMTTEAATPMEPETAGLLLRQAREAAGLSLDAVAQQLKLAPRQVEAMEDGDYTRLPGRTFVRGFMRNYARLLNLDPETVLSALPGAAAAPALEAPALHATAPSIGELPTAQRSKSGWTRWAIPLVLIAIVVGAATYEYVRQGPESPRNGARAPAPGPAPATKSIGESTTPLPNPLAATDGGAPDEAAPPTAATEASPAPAALDAAGPARVATGAPPAATVPEDATIVLTYRDFSWTEVRDRNGRVLVAKMMKAGEQQAVSGPPPLDVVIGNSVDVRVTYRGLPVDLAPLSRGNVARFTLK